MNMNVFKLSLQPICLFIISSLLLRACAKGDYKTSAQFTHEHSIFLLFGSIFLISIMLTGAYQYIKKLKQKLKHHMAMINLLRSVFLTQETMEKELEPSHRIKEYVFELLNQQWKKHGEKRNLNCAEYDLIIVVSYPKMKFIITNRQSKHRETYSEIDFSITEKIQLYELITTYKNRHYFRQEI